MARCRNIKASFFFNEKLAEVDPLGRILFIGLWGIADREGRLEDRPRKIKAEVLPYDDCDIDHLLTELHQKGFIVRYEVAGEEYIWIRNFTKHQYPHIKEAQSVIPEYYPQNYPQGYTQVYPQNCPQAVPEEQVVLSDENPADPTTTGDTAIPEASTGISDTFPPESFILNTESPILIPELFIPESGAEANLGSDSEPEDEPEADVEIDIEDEDPVENEDEEADKSTYPVAGTRGIIDIAGMAGTAGTAVIAERTGTTKTAAAAAMEKELSRSLSPLECEQVLNWEKKYGSQMVKEALKIAVLKGACRLKFIGAILLEWEKANIRTYHEVLNYELQRKGKGRATYLTTPMKDLDGLYEL